MLYDGVVWGSMHNVHWRWLNQHLIFSNNNLKNAQNNLYNREHCVEYCYSAQRSWLYNVIATYIGSAQGVFLKRFIAHFSSLLNKLPDVNIFQPLQKVLGTNGANKPKGSTCHFWACELNWVLKRWCRNDSMLFFFFERNCWRKLLLLVWAIGLFREYFHSCSVCKHSHWPTLTYTI